MSGVVPLRVGMKGSAPWSRATLVGQGHRVLSHCGMGFNRSALVAGLILNRLGMPGPQVVEQLRERRAGALFNEHFARHLEALGPSLDRA